MLSWGGGGLLEDSGVSPIGFHSSFVIVHFVHLKDIV